MVVAEANDHGGTTNSEVAAQLGLHNPFVVLHVGKMVKKGLLNQKTNKVDGRSKILRLTDEAAALLDSMAPLIQVANDTLFRSVPPSSFLSLAQTCRAIVGNAGVVAAAIEVEREKVISKLKDQ
ncbi:MarR family winged helix-turn-helix transcriptional regulator [Tardiphaga sp.]|jgi:DNA-binding MarR family transcriptional regulator|uniref:MarR family winged helix-turn-helix transcriptional regulator n=1 Tax=Tardiphaga sp. TaxID=1926292 RepID=UPI0037DA263C